MSELKMPLKGKGALMLQELNAEHAPPHIGEQDPIIGEVTNVTTLQLTPVSTKDETGVTTMKVTNKRPKKETRSETNFELGDRHPLRDEVVRIDRVTNALQMGEEDEMSVVTVRVSTRLNEYMDRYVQRINQVNPKRKYRKQDAILEAFAAFFADHILPPAPADDEL